MNLSRRVVVCGLAALAVCALGVAPTWARQNAPKLDKNQRATLEVVVAAVDQAAASGAAQPADFHVHVLRASDGLHYVALAADVGGLIAPKDATVLYVRLATRRPADVTVTAERSAVMEWLKGLRADPLPMRAARSMSVPAGELPIGGAASFAGDIAADSSNALRLAERERAQRKAERDEREKQRRAELENAAKAPAAVMHPFEDFDVQARLAASATGVRVVRSVRAGPGDYVLYVAWAESVEARKPPVVRVVAHPLVLPAASTTDFALSDIVLADAVAQVDSPYPADRQNAHPYALGALEAEPARDHVFRVDEALSVMFQVINAAATPTGKPDVEVGFRVSRILGEREEHVGNLPVQRFSAANLPVDFDVAKGHPLFAAVQAPLARFTRGRYRMTITASDHVAERRTTRAVDFEVRGTAESLLREAPTPGQAFRREAILAPATLQVIARALAPAMPSEAMSRALAAASAGRFADLVRDEPVTPAERPAAQALRGLALYGLGDTSRAVTAQLQQAATQGAAPGPVLVVLGATYALSGDDKAAIVAWNQAREGGIDDASVATLLVDAYLRQGDVARASAMARAALDAQPDSAAAARAMAATQIATGQFAAALAVLDARPVPVPDPDTDLLVMHALYAGFVTGKAPGNTAEGRARLQTLGARYVAGAEPHAALVTAWLAVVAAAPARP